MSLNPAGRVCGWRCPKGHIRLPIEGGDQNAARTALDNLLKAEAREAELHFFQGNWQADGLWPLSLSDRGAPNHHAVIGPTPDLRSAQFINLGGGSASDAPPFLGDWLRDSVYVFRAERLAVVEAPISAERELSPNAGNLASVLLSLPSYHREKVLFTKCVQEIFPSVFDITARPSPNNGTQAIVEVTNRDMGRTDPEPGVSVSLADSGTGIGQVAAILYAAITAPWPRVIVIDEPNTFLHPSASRKLMAILKTFDHQYILTTHSPDIIRMVEPDFVHLAKWDGRSSRVQSLDSSSLGDLKGLLAELGVRLSDLFGADQVFWVEGPTEEHCFPLLVDHQLPPGTSILAVTNPDDLVGGNRRVSEIAVKVYERLSAGSAVVPPALAFSFDREGRTQAEMDDLRRRSGGRVHFLPRRTYENYLVDAEAIAAVLSQDLGATRDWKSAVKDWLASRGLHRDYVDRNFAGARGDAEWLREVKAPQLLARLFSEVSETKLQYRKTVHSVELTKWLLANRPEALTELRTYLADIIAGAPARS